MNGPTSIFDDPTMRPMVMKSRVGKETTNQNLILQKLDAHFNGESMICRKDKKNDKYSADTDKKIQNFLGAIQHAEMFSKGPVDDTKKLK